MLNALRLSGNTNISIFTVGLNFKDLDHIVNCHFRNNPDEVIVQINVIADVLDDFILPIDLNFEYGQLSLQNLCNGSCKYSAF